MNDKTNYEDISMRQGENTAAQGLVSTFSKFGAESQTV